MTEKKNIDIRPSRNIIFADNIERKVYPLTIRQLRKFMKVMQGIDLEQDKMDDNTIDKMVEAAKIALEKDYPDVASSGDIEDLLDMRSFNELFSAAMGADPNA